MCTCLQCNLAQYFLVNGHDMSSPPCQTMLAAIAFTKPLCLNTCVDAFSKSLQSMLDNSCSNIDAPYASIALASLALVCGDAGDGNTCADLYATSDEVWTCQAVDRLGCCWTSVLKYVEAIEGADFRARVENGASKHQNKCSPNNAACGIIRPSSALSNAAPSVVALAAVLAAMLHALFP